MNEAALEALLYPVRKVRPIDSPGSNLTPFTPFLSLIVWRSRSIISHPQCTNGPADISPPLRIAAVPGIEHG